MAKNYSTMGYIGLTAASTLCALFNDTIASGIGKLVNTQSVNGGSLDDAILAIGSAAAGYFGARLYDKLKR